MIFVKTYVYVDKKDRIDGQFLIKMIQDFVEEHCKIYKHTYVCDIDLRVLKLPEEQEKQKEEQTQNEQEH